MSSGGGKRRFGYMSNTEVKETTDAAAKQEAGTLLLLFHFINIEDDICNMFYCKFEKN
ncbi:hypothetical protein Bca101_031550 [Brassica carinata]